MNQAEAHGKELVLPLDAVVAPELKPGVASRVVSLAEVGPQDMILDVGPESVEAIKRVFDRALTLVWNGPLGAFEIPPFDEGTRVAAMHAGALTRAGSLVSIAGGGDTVAALNAAMWRTPSPSCRQPAGRSSNGWRASRCRASRFSSR